MSEEPKQEIQSENKTKKKPDPYTIRVLVVFVLALVILLAGAIFLHSQMKIAKREETTYYYHYVFVGANKDAQMLSSICAEAQSYGENHGAYVEALETAGNSAEAYANGIRMAQAMRADGILVAGADTEDMKQAIADAQLQEEIPVVTVLSDCPDSARKTLIETDPYDLGRAYARGIIGVTETRSPQITIFMNNRLDDSFLQGIEETLEHEGNHLDVSIEIRDASDLPNFRLMDQVREMLDAQNHPDILLCPDEYQTKLIYQTMQDYNLTAKTQLIGYGMAESLLRAVSGGEIEALLYIDAQQTGMMCVDALNGYLSTGSIRDHITVENIMITRDNAERYLNE